MKHLVKILVCLTIMMTTPLFAWYYFTASNGQRTQWIWGSSCNSGSRPITVKYDTDIPAGYNANIATVLGAWNGVAGVGNIFCPVATCSIAANQTTMSLSAVKSFLANPTPNQVWLVWDSDGSIFNYIGVDPSSSVLGIGIGVGLSNSRPQDICSGILFLNGYSGNISSSNTFQRVLLHELGHVLGLAHSIAGNNGSLTVGASGSLCGGNACIPVMSPFLYTNSPLVLNPDEIAAIKALYAP